MTGVDVLELPEIHHRVDRFIQADLDQGLPPEVAEGGPYDIVLAADVLEHVREPERLLDEIRGQLVAHGSLIASVPNFGHWYTRGRTLLGMFEYDQRGILDRGHVRFFTRRGILRRLRAAKFSVVRLEATGLPLEVLTNGSSRPVRAAEVLDRAAVSVWPTLFGYQFVCLCESAAPAGAARRC